MYFLDIGLIAVCTVILLELSVRRPVPRFTVQVLQVMDIMGEVACGSANQGKGSASTESATSSAFVKAGSADSKRSKR